MDNKNKLDKPKSKKYTNQIAAAIHAKQTLAVDEHLFVPEPDGMVPLLMMNAPYSRFTLTIIDKTRDEDLIVSCNILASGEFPLLKNMYYKTLFSSENTKSEELSPAYTVTIKTGYFKGNTPAQVLINDPTKKDELIRTRGWLADNISKFPANKETMDAIDDAIKLFESNKLENSKSGGTAKVVFERQFKQMNGYKVQASIKICYDTSNRVPWNIYIQNSDITEVKPDGTVTTTNPRYSTIFLNDEEMAEIIRAMDDTLMCFKLINYRPLKKMSDEMAWKPDGMK